MLQPVRVGDVIGRYGSRGDDRRKHPLARRAATTIGWMILGGATFMIIARDVFDLSTPYVAVGSTLGLAFGAWLALGAEPIRWLTRRRR
jgi:hypothetical protein